MGQILVDRGFITPEQLAEALRSQEQTGRLLGEICVEKWGLDRFALADAFGEQWDAIDQGLRSTGGRWPGSRHLDALRPDTQDVRALLAEAESAHARLHLRTDDLERRLAALEALVAGIGDGSRSLAPCIPHRMRA